MGVFVWNDASASESEPSNREHGDTCEWVVSDGFLQSPERCGEEAEYTGRKHYVTGTVSVPLCESHAQCVTDDDRIEVMEI